MEREPENGSSSIVLAGTLTRPVPFANQLSNNLSIHELDAAIGPGPWRRAPR
jgi:hypothetical protein